MLRNEGMPIVLRECACETTAQPPLSILQKSPVVYSLYIKYRVAPFPDPPLLSSIGPLSLSLSLSLSRLLLSQCAMLPKADAPHDMDSASHNMDSASHNMDSAQTKSAEDRIGGLADSVKEDYF
jgi:hypothetical protein